MKIASVQQQVWNNKVLKGFNTFEAPLVFGMLHETAATAFTAWRKNEDRLGEELADVVLYVTSIAEITGLDTEQEIKTKVDKNDARAD